MGARLAVGLFLVATVVFGQAAVAEGGKSEGWGLPASVSSGAAVAVLYFWRQDRQDRAVAQAEADKRYQALATDFRQIVTENTAAIAHLSSTLGSRPCLLSEKEPHRR